MIDDFFCISSQEKALPKEDTSVYRLVAEARAAYESHGLLGSPEKDIIAEDVFKAAGCEIVASHQAVSVGFPPAAAPISKRLGLGLVSLRALLYLRHWLLGFREAGFQCVSIGDVWQAW